MINKNSFNYKVILFLIISVSILGTISTFVLSFINLSFDLDMYQIIAAANEVSDKKLGGVSFFPNSSLGIDILFWPYIFPSLLYSFFTNIFSNLYQFYFLITFEYLISICLLLLISFKLLKLFRWSNSKKIIIIFFSLVFLSPLFNQYFIGGKSTYRWCFIFTLISINFLINILLKKENSNKNNFACGLFSSLAPLSFVSMGLPIFVGIQLNILIHTFFTNKSSIKKKITNYIYFILGTIIPLIFITIYIKNNGNKEEIQNLIKLVFSYGREVSPFSLSNFIIKYGYFTSSLFITSYAKVSFLPIFILSLIIHLFYFKNLPEHIKTFTRLLSVFFISWLIIAIPFSSHLYAPRISIINPLFICLFINLFFINSKNNFGLIFFIYFSIFIYICQIISVELINNYSLLAISVPAGLIIFIIFLFIFFHKFLKGKKFFIKKNYLEYSFFTITILLLLKVFYLKSSSIYNLINSTYKNYVINKIVIPDHKDYLIEARKKIKKYINDQDYILTNKPYKDLFPDNKIIALFGYRTFYGGAIREPADKIFIFKNGGYFEKEIDQKSIVYFKGFHYKIIKKININKNDYFFYGESTNYSGENYLRPKDFYIKKDKVDKYFEWREKNINEK